MSWDLATIRETAWNTAFKRGWQAWFRLVTVCFIFAFIGATNATQASFVDGLDRVIGSSDILQPHNTQVLDSYIASLPSVHDLIESHPDIAHDIINSMTERTSWVVSILALNPRYLADNPGEATAMVFIAALLTFFLRFFVLNVIAIGQYRYVTLAAEEQQAIDAHAPRYVLEDLDVSRSRDVKGALPYAVVDLIYIFFVFCFIGWVWEVGLHFFQYHEFVNRGTLYGPWIPIYGFGGAGMVILLDRYREDPVKIFALGVALSAVLEYATSFVLDFMFNASYWSYNDMMFNLNGRICLAGLVAFGLGGLAGVYLAGPAVSHAVNKMPVSTRYLGAAALSAAFCADLVYCVLNGFNTGAGVGEEL